jgi:hypothetical protein
VALLWPDPDAVARFAEMVLLFTTSFPLLT